MKPPQALLLLAVFGLSALPASGYSSTGVKTGSLEILDAVGPGLEVQQGKPAAVSFTVKNNGFKAPFEARLVVKDPDGVTVFNSKNDPSKQGVNFQLAKGASVTFVWNISKMNLPGTYSYIFVLRNRYVKKWQISATADEKTYAPFFTVSGVKHPDGKNPLAPAAEGMKLQPSVDKVSAPPPLKEKEKDPQVIEVPTVLTGTGLKFKPQVIEVPVPLMGTGLKFKPQVIEVPVALTGTGLKFKPQVIEVPTVLTGTGLKFKPQVIEVPVPLMGTGLKFKPQMIEVPEALTATGLKTASPSAAPSLQVVPTKMTVTTNNSVTGDFSGQKILLKGGLVQGDAITFYFPEAKNNSWKFKVGESFDITWTPEAYPFSMKIAGKVTFGADGVVIAFAMGKVTYAAEEFLDHYEIPVTIGGPKGEQASLAITVTPGAEVEPE